MPAGQEDRAREFYCGILGFLEVPKPPHLARRGGLWLESRGVRVHLGVDPDFRPARKAHPGLLVSGLDTLTDRIRDAGHRVEEGEPLEGYAHCYVEDPFGNRLELMEREGRR